LEFMVSLDFYLNETTRHADLILPPTSPLEHDHYDLALNVFAVRNIARYSAPLFDKPAGSLHDWEIFLRLGEALASKLGVDPRRLPPPSVLLDMGLKAGPYGAASRPEDPLDFKRLAAQPHGMDLGPLAPCLPGRLVHAQRKIQCAPGPLLEDLPRLLREAPPAADGRLLLIGRRHLRSNNSWMHNYERLVKGKPRNHLLMHPDDAHRLELVSGQMVRVRSRVGQVEVALELGDAMMRGVVCLPHGWGHGRDLTRLEVANRHAGVSINDLTDDQDVDALSGNAVLNGVQVTVEAV